MLPTDTKVPERRAPRCRRRKMAPLLSLVSLLALASSTIHAASAKLAEPDPSFAVTVALRGNNFINKVGIKHALYGRIDA